MTKQIAIGLLATVTLGLFGIGSYYASRQLFPDPTATGTVTPTTSTSDSKVPSIADMKRLEPKNIVTKADGDNISITFETAEKVGTYLYVTSIKSEKVDQVMTDHSNGIPSSGRWFTVSTKAEPKSTHSVTFPKSIMASTGDTYYFVVVDYKKYWLPYGAIGDPQNGVSEPYTIKL